MTCANKYLTKSINLILVIMQNKKVLCSIWGIIPEVPRAVVASPKLMQIIQVDIYDTVWFIFALVHLDYFIQP